MQNRDCQKLRNCPFCGGEAYYYQDENGIAVEDMTVEPGIMHYVLCSDCSALVSGRSREEVTVAWNSRYEKEARNARWLKHMYSCQCSYCGWDFGYSGTPLELKMNEFKYCPNCGANMRSKEG